MGCRDFYHDSIDGLRLYCGIHEPPQPAALTVLCLPGLTRNSRDFRPLAALLSTRYRVLTPDLRGRGRSAYDPNWRNYHPAIYYRDLIELLAALKIGRLAVIGTSLGGILAMSLAAYRPGGVAGIVLNDIGPELAPAGAERIRNYVGKLPPVRDWSEAVRQTREVNGPAVPGLTDLQWLEFAHALYREEPSGEVRVDMDPMIGTALREAPAAPVDLWPLFAMIRQTPMLAIRGALSDLLSAQTFERMAREKPDLQRLTLADRGHTPTLNETQCVAAIERFLLALN